jgi:hypothetical protein
MSVTIGDDALGRAVSLISAFCGHPLGQPAKGASTSAKTSEGPVTGLAACATALAAQSKAATDLLGRTAAERAQVRPPLQPRAMLPSPPPAGFAPPCERCMGAQPRFT